MAINISNLTLVPKAERRTFLLQGIEELKKGIVNIELDIRYLEREKIKGQHLEQIENKITGSKQIKQAMEDKLETALDILKELGG